MIHTEILFGCLAFGWAVAALVLHLAPRFKRWGDRRAMHQLALFSPLLALVLAGGWSVHMTLEGCLNFTTQDGIGTLLLMGTLAAALVVAAFRATWQGVQVQRQLAQLGVNRIRKGLRPLVKALAGRLDVKSPSLVVLATRQPVACVIGVTRPTLFVSKGVLDILTADELEAVVAHELAHMRHMDNLLAWLDVILLRAFRFLPPLHRAWRESLAEREEAADALAVRATGTPLALASALLRILEADAVVAREYRALPLAAVSSFAGDVSHVERRVDRLVAPVTADHRPWGLPAVGAAIASIALPLFTTWVLGTLTACFHH